MSNSLPYEILVRGENGVFKGAHVIDTPGATARKIAADDWPEIAIAVNGAALSRIAWLEVATETAKTAADAAIAEAATVNKAASDATAAAAAATATAKATVSAANSAATAAAAEKNAVKATLAEHQQLVDAAFAQASAIVESMPEGEHKAALQALLTAIAEPVLARKRAELEAQKAKALEAAEATQAAIDSLPSV